MTAVRYENPAAPDGAPRTGGPLLFALDLRAETATVVRCLSFGLFSLHGQLLLNAELATTGGVLDLRPGSNVVRIAVRELHLNAGTYVMGLWIASRIEDQTPLDAFEGGPNLVVLGTNHDNVTYPWAYGPVSCDFVINAVTDNAQGDT
jgi:hypothetical protein